MDEVKLTAQQRFDLLDMTRLQSFIKNGFAHMARLVMGARNHYGLSSGDWGGKAPLIAYPYLPIKQGAPSLTLRVNREFSVGGVTFEAAVYDKDGERVGGPNSPTYRDLTVVAAPGSVDRYVQIRRVATNDTSEPRKFYTTGSGKTTQTVDTRTIDDYEVQDSTTSADSDATLRDAGWVDVAVFQTNGTDDITLLYVYEQYPMRDILSWAAVPPYSDVTPIGVFEWLAGLRQIAKRMRFGAGALSREWNDDPLTDGCFEEGDSSNSAGGGVRFGDPTGGLSDVFIRQINDVVTVGVNTMSSLAALRDFMARGVYAEDADPSNGKGHLYGTSGLGPSSPSVIIKPYSVPACDFRPDGPQDPWTVGSAPSVNVNEWGWNTRVFSGVQGQQTLDIWWNTSGALDSPYVCVPIKVLDKCGIYQVYVQFFMTGNWVNAADLGIEGAVMRQAVGGGGFSAPSGTKQFFSLAASTRHDLLFHDNYSGDPMIFVDNDAYAYWVVFRVTDTNVAGQGNLGNICSPEICRVRTLINEASHVYGT